MGSSSRHRDRSRDRDRDRDRDRSDRDRDRDNRDRDRDRDRGRDRDRDRRDKGRNSNSDRHRDRDRRDRGDRGDRGNGGGGDRDRRSRSGSRDDGGLGGGSMSSAATAAAMQLQNERQLFASQQQLMVHQQMIDAQPSMTHIHSIALAPPTVVTPQRLGDYDSNLQDGEKLLAETLANIAASRNFSSLINKDDEYDSKKKKRSRWGGNEHEKVFIPGMPTILPGNLNKDQEEAYLLQLQIEEVSRKLRSGNLGISVIPEERSPSPEPIYSSDGKRLNTREFRTRRKLEEDRHTLVLRMQQINPDFKPPIDYKPPVIRVSDKVMIPQDEHPEINFVGLLIGPRGNTLKTMEKDTGAKIIIRGKGSVKEGKVGRKDGQPLPGEDEPLHAYITATNPEHVKKAVERIKEVIRQGVEVPENQNDLRRMQLRELAQLNGTLRENDGLRCNNCGATDHKSWLCPDKPNVTNNIVCSSCGGAGHIARDCRQKRPGLGGPPGTGDKAKIDEEYMSLMAELGEGPPPDFMRNSNDSGSNGMSSSTNRKPNMPGLFDTSAGAPRALMAPPPPPPGAGMAPPPHMMPPWAAGPPPMGPGGWMGGPPPPGVMPPPPPPPGASSPPQWGGVGGAMTDQPPPPGGGGGMMPVPSPGGMMMPPPWAFGWGMVPQPDSTAALTSGSGIDPSISTSMPPPTSAPMTAPPPTGSSSLDFNALLSAPPPPPPPPSTTATD